MILGRRLERVVDIVGEVLAMGTLALILLLYINGRFPFISGDILTTLMYVREVAIVSVLGLKALEFALKRNIIAFLIFAAIIVAAFVFMFQAGAIPTWNMLGLVA